MTLDVADRILANRRGKANWDYALERYWEKRALAPYRWYMGGGERGCTDRVGVVRKSHDLDKDGRCVFCDWLKPDVV
jgi:hypothetical protein